MFDYQQVSSHPKSPILLLVRHVSTSCEWDGIPSFHHSRIPIPYLSPVSTQWQFNIAMENDPVEIVSLPMKNVGSVHSYVNDYHIG